MRINTPTTTAPAATSIASTKMEAASEAAEAKTSSDLLKDQAERADKLLKQVEEAVERVKDSVKLRQNSLEFQVDDLPDKTVVVTVRDKDTKEVVRQIPSEEMLRISEALKDGLDPSSEGLLVRGQA